VKEGENKEGGEGSEGWGQKIPSFRPRRPLCDSSALRPRSTIRLHKHLRPLQQEFRRQSGSSSCNEF